MNPIQLTFFYFFLIALAVLVGGILPVLKRWNASRFPIFLSFSAGLLLGTTFFHLIGHATELLHADVGIFVLLGMLFLYLFEKFITVHICEEEYCEVHKIGISAFIGLSIHSLIDGLALGAGMLTNIKGFGTVVFVAIFFHKVMEAFSLTSILMHLQKTFWSILGANLVLLLTIPIGALIALFVVDSKNSYSTGVCLAFSAGTFLHIALSDLLPEVHRHSKLKNKAIVAFLIGLVLMFGLSQVLEISEGGGAIKEQGSTVRVAWDSRSSLSDAKSLMERCRQ